MRFIYTKAFAVFFICLFVIFLFVFLQTKGFIDPIRNLVLQSPRPIIKIFSWVASPVKSFFGTVYKLKEIVNENNNLKSEVVLLKQDVVNLEQERKENIALRNELGFVKSTKNSLIPCTVLSRNALGISGSVSLNCGSNEGVEEGYAITSQGYIVGKVVYVAKKTSVAILATSSKFSADAKVLKTEQKTIVSGSFDSGITLEIQQNENIEKKSILVTAGINEKIPKNLLIGEIGDSLSSANDLFKRYTVISPINFENLEFVFVVK